mmetsp:Transcript_15525/g.32832  ORF Transcript_15525/g.32832 Transcript_15525/m.32832 type:complete len:86 (+) Transcript_15525:233-490(+)
MPAQVWVPRRRLGAAPSPLVLSWVFWQPLLVPYRDGVAAEEGQELGVEPEEAPRAPSPCEGVPCALVWSSPGEPAELATPMPTNF